MTGYIAVFTLLAASEALTQSPGDNAPGEMLVRKLSSASFQEREAADKALRLMPSAAPLLRRRLELSPDSETGRRIHDILRYYELQPVRDLDAAVKRGEVLSIVNMVGSWKPKQFETESWKALADFANIIHEHNKSRPEISVKLAKGLRNSTPYVISAEVIDRDTAGRFNTCSFLRAGEVDLSRTNRKKNDPIRNVFELDSAVVLASKGIRMGLPDAPKFIVCGGDIELTAGETHNCIIVCGGNISFKGCCYSSLLIARGSISVSDGLAESVLIAGKSVKHVSKQPNTILENEPHPLGFIRWTDAPKKDAAK